MKRRLPVIQSASGGREDELRSPTAWRVAGAVLAFTLWLPLSMLGGALSKALVGAQVDVAHVGPTAHVSGASKLAITLAASGPPLLAFVLACVLSGTLVGRFGSGTRPRDAGIGGALAAGAGCGVAALGGAFPSWGSAAVVLLLMVGVGYPSAALAARFLGRSGRSGPGVDPEGSPH
jgi:hypothetical protein